MSIMSTRSVWILVLILVPVFGQVRKIRMKTGIHHDTDQLQIEPTGTSFTFRVRAKNDATIVLFSTWTYSSEAYELVIGGWKNTRSVVRRYVRSRYLKQDIKTPNVLNRDEYRDFWVKWTGGIIQLGRGKEIGRQRILHWKDPQPRTIVMVALTSGYNSDGIWEIPQDAAKWTKIRTPYWKTNNLAWFSTTDVSIFTFRVKACHNVHLALSQTFGIAKTLTYEVVIGDWSNTKSALIRGKEIQTKDTRYFLHCQKFRSFWVSWKEGLVAIGRGSDIGSKVFLQHNFSDPQQINAVSISTGYRASGEWEFLNPAVCSAGKWGFHCASACSPGCHSTCDGVTGTCQCKGGWYGSRCHNRCSNNCVNTTSCDRIHGHCLCNRGFKLPTCESVCDRGFYGQNCTRSCSPGCRRGECGKSNGTCVCLVTHYKEDCNETCGSGCSSLPCNKETGQCTCKPGWQRPMCDTQCRDGYWGAGCTEKCSENCSNVNNCSKTDGTCTCNPGYRGAICNQTCDEGTFGFNCESTCHCKGGHDDCSKVNGTCESGQCVEGREGVACQTLSDQTSSSYLKIALGIGIAAIILLLLVMVLTVLFLRRRKRRKESAKKVNHITLDEVPTASTSHTSPKHNANQSFSDAVNYENLGIRVAEFPDYVRGMKQSENGFQEEYESLQTGLSAPCEVGSTGEASIKNRFRNIIAYDHSRVFIGGDTPLSQYINANFINGFGAPKSFIASQGPVEDTVADFIQMLWEQKVPLVVMLTNLEEKGKVKCFQYWPEQISTGSITHRGIIMRKLKEEKFPHFIIRHLELEKDNMKQPLTQIQYISWPDHGVPESPAAFLEFHQKAKQMYKPDAGATVVHCSAGVGRTGTFLAVDYLLEQAEREGFVSISDCVKLMRKDRVNMVQSLDQYVFIHESVLEALHCGKTVYDATSYDGLTSSVDKQELSKQYEMLEKMKPFVSNENLLPAKSKENRKKNRSQDVLANSKWRPLLRTNETETNDYINAVFVHGYQKKHAFIATQSPLPSTVVDIWRLLKDYESNTIIALNDTGSERTCPNYWENDDGEIGPFTVDTIEETESDVYIRRHLKLKYKGEERKVMQFQVKSWNSGTLPVAATLLSLYGEVKAWQQESGDSRIIVHCLYGAAETGLYICLCHVCDKIEREQEVDVFHAVQKIRKSQPLFITSKEQYEWLHQAAYDYISSFSMYANFK